MTNKTINKKNLLTAVAVLFAGAFCQHVSAQNNIATLNVNLTDIKTIQVLNQPATIDLQTAQDYIDAAGTTGVQASKSSGHLLVRSIGSFVVDATVNQDLKSASSTISAADITLTLSNPALYDGSGAAKGVQTSGNFAGTAYTKQIDGFIATTATTGILSGSGTTGTVFDAVYGIHNVTGVVDLPKELYTTTITYTLETK